jgi:hypothetical protein
VDLDELIRMPEPEDGEDEVQILEPPPIPVIDLVSEDETKLPQTLPKRVSEESDSDIEILGEHDRVVYAWGKWRRTARKTKRMKVSIGSPRRELDFLGCVAERETGYTRRTGGFYEPHIGDA